MKKAFLLMLCVISLGLSASAQDNARPTPNGPRPIIPAVTAAQINGLYRYRRNDFRILALGHNKLKVQYERRTSPLFLAGESYGTTRASALSGYLIGRGIAFNGIVLISTIMNFETADFAAGNDLPYVMFLPSYAATAWYHKKLPSDLQSKSVQQIVSEVEQWATNDYRRREVYEEAVLVNCRGIDAFAPGLGPKRD
jgi:hypothetical protein